MRSIFPYTESRRYERMTVAALAAIVCAISGVALLSTALEAGGGGLALTQALQFQGHWRAALSFAALAAGCFALAASFFCSFLIKIHLPGMDSYFHIYLRVQWVAQRLLWLACGFGVAFVLVQVLAGTVVQSTAAEAPRHVEAQRSEA